MSPRPAIFAHRGVSQNTRENTILAFELAVNMGVDGVELDIWQTRDGHIVVHHDPHVDGISIEKANVSELPNFVPMLPAVLDVCGSLRVNIEIKSSDENPRAAFQLGEALIDLLKIRSEPLERWLVSSFNHDAVDRVNQSAPELPTALLFWETPWRSTIEQALERGHQAVHPHESIVDRDLVEAAKQNGLQVNPWTVNDLERANQLVAMGVDGLITDVPSDILKHLDAKS